MNWANISEQTISGVSATLMATIITWLFKRAFVKKIPSQDVKLAPAPFKLSLFQILLFLTSFTAVITFFSLVYVWVVFNYVYLSFATFILGTLTYLVYENQCPNCNRIFKKKLVKKETLHEEKRPYTYKDLTIYLYSDDSEKDRKYTGNEKTKMETWRTEKRFYKCTACDYEWDKIFEKNLDLQNRPKPNIVRTQFKPPQDFRF